MKNQIVSLTKKVLRHMVHKAQGHQAGGILLTGAPGIGKTSFVNMIGSLLGMKTVVIEVPHVTEEHLINIPFLVFNPQTNTTQQLSSKMTPSYELVLAQSNLFTQLTSAQVLTDDQYLQHIMRAPRPVQNLYVQLGGTQEKIPPIIQHARQNHTALLFLDEYYRQASMRIRNIMRGILNNKIGMHQLPRSVYVLYASNMRDTGLEDIPSNHQFQAVEFRIPSKKDWFEYLIAKYEEDQDVKLNMQVINKFHDLLEDEDLSHTDVEKEVRTSPRRWEQLLLYINTSIPVKDEKEAVTLLTNVRNNFINYQSEQHSGLANKVIQAVAELIKETSNITVSADRKLEPNEWRTALAHIVEQQMKSGNKRKHIPVVSGPPGIGKTMNAFQVAKKYNLRLIDIDVSEIYSDDVIGLPIPGERDDNDIKVKFSLPKLFQQINRQIEKADADYVAELKEKYGAKAREMLEKYEKQRFKYLIFFDEINRVDEKTFNALRKVILEKSFGPAGDDSGTELSLPKDAIVIAAMNPEGVGTSELTQHFRDVIDVIPSRASWKDTKTWLMSKDFNHIPEQIKEAAMNILEEFINKFKSDNYKKVSPDTAAFHLDVGTEMYISPREYNDVFSTLVRELHAAIEEVRDEEDITDDEIRDRLDEVVSESLEDSLSFIFYKHQVEKDEFMATMKRWVSKLDDRVFKGLLYKEAKLNSSLSETLDHYFDGRDVTTMPGNNNIVNANNSLNNAQFIDQVKDLIHRKLKDSASVKKYILDETQGKIELSGHTLKHSSTKVSLIENFVLGLLYTLHLHQYQNDRIVSVGKALSAAISQTLTALLKSGKIDDEMKQEASIMVVQIRGDIHDLIDSL